MIEFMMAESKSEETARSQFTAQSSTAEDLLKSQTVGLVNFSDFRKRRFEAIERKEKETQGPSSSTASTPVESRASTPANNTGLSRPSKKRKPTVTRGKLSFGVDDEDPESESALSVTRSSRTRTPTPDLDDKVGSASDTGGPQRKLGPNSSIGNAPRLLTKAALAKEAEMRETLRKEFLERQKVVRATEFAIPFVFYDGTNIPGGICRMQKGDHIWLFLDKSRKLGAERGVGDSDKSKKEWARISVDDLMMVRGELIIPHHYEFYYFAINNIETPKGRLFNYSAEPSAASPALSDLESDVKNYDPLSRPGKKRSKLSSVKLQDLEGTDDDAVLTKVVDRRWYERNKHIYPASVWQEFDPTKDYSSGLRKDTHGNAYFLS